MKRLIILRQANNDGASGLSEGAEADLHIVCTKLKEKLGDMKVVIVAAREHAAAATAVFVSNFFHAHASLADGLHVDESSPANLPAALSLIRAYDEAWDALIVVVDEDYSRTLHNHYGQFDLGDPFRGGMLAKGDAWYIDCEEVTLQRVTSLQLASV